MKKPLLRSLLLCWIGRYLYELWGRYLPGDDIVLFEYLKKNNRETGAALVGLELRRASDIDALLRRMDESPLECRRLEPGTPEYDYLT